MMKPGQVVGAFGFRDLMMYIVPGASLLGGLALVGYFFYPNMFEHLSSALASIDSVVLGLGFVILSYVLGHLMAIPPLWVPPWLTRPDAIIEAIKDPRTAPKDVQHKAKIIREAIRDYLKEGEATEEILDKGNFDDILHILDKYVHIKAPEAYDFWVARQYAIGSLRKGLALSCPLLLVSLLPFFFKNALDLSSVWRCSVAGVLLVFTYFLFAKGYSNVTRIPDRATLDIFYVLSRENERPGAGAAEAPGGEQ